MYEFLKPLQLHCLRSVTSITGMPTLSGATFKITDINGLVLAQYFPKVFCQSELEVLLESTRLLFEQTPSKTDEYRSIDSVFHFECWRESAKEPFITSDTRTTAATKWINTNSTIFKKANQVFKESMPTLHA